MDSSAEASKPARVVSRTKQAGGVWLPPEVKRLPRKLSKLDEAMAVIKGRLSATAFKLLWGQRAYKDHLEQASRCPSVLQASVPGDIAHLDEEEEKELAEAVPSQVFEPPTPEELLQLPERHLRPAFHPDAVDEWRFNPDFTRWHDLRLEYGFAFEVPGRQLSNGIWKWDWSVWSSPLCGGLTPVRLMACLMWVNEQPDKDTLPPNHWPVVPSEKFLQMVASKQQREHALQAKYESEAWLLDREGTYDAATVTHTSLEQIVRQAHAKGVPEHKLPLVYEQARMVRSALGGVDAQNPAPAPPQPKPCRCLRCRFTRAMGGDPEYAALLKKHKNFRMFLRVGDRW